MKRQREKAFNTSHQMYTQEHKNLPEGDTSLILIFPLGRKRKDTLACTCSKYRTSAEVPAHPSVVISATTDSPVMVGIVLQIWEYMNIWMASIIY